MDLAASSSEDECDIYVNAVSKLKALSHRDRNKVKDEGDNGSNVIITEEPNNTLLKENCNTKEAASCRNNSDNTEVNSKNPKSIDEQVTVILDDDDSNDVIMCLEGDSESIDETIYTMRSGRIIRKSNKKKSSIPSSLEAPIIVNDSIENELNDTYHDSLDLTQEDNDSYVLIGSPPPSKKSKADDYEVSVKVLWKSNKVERFDIKRNETLQKIFRHFANLEGVHEDQILITKKEKRITPFDTPISINWSIIDILDGGVVSAEIVKKNKIDSSKSKVQENTCQIKIQTSDKRSLSISLKNDETFTNLLKKCSEELKVPETKIKLYFDGELIDEEETPESLDLDEEACVDLKIIK